MEYKLKYEKYKTKYLELKNTIDTNQLGGKTENKPELYLFKAEWCGHCKSFKDDWGTLSQNSHLKEKVNFVTYDSEQNKNAINEWQVTGFPTLILKNGDKAIEYSGSRTVSAIEKFIKDNIN